MVVRSQLTNILTRLRDQTTINSNFVKILRKKQAHFHKQKAEFVKFIYSEKAAKFCKISSVDLTVTTYVEILQNFVAFSENMNFVFRIGRLIYIQPEIQILNELFFTECTQSTDNEENFLE